MPCLSLDAVVGVRRDDDAYGTGEAVDEAEAEAELGGWWLGLGSKKVGERGAGQELQTWYGKAGGDSGADSPTCMACRGLGVMRFKSPWTGEDVLLCLVRVGREGEWRVKSAAGCLRDSRKSGKRANASLV